MKNNILMIAVACIVAGCGQSAVKSGWGSMIIDLPCDQKLINISWKGESADLWTLTRPFRPTDQPEQHRFKANATFGLLEGAVVIREHKCS